VIDELQPPAAGEIVDRKYRLEDFLQTRMQPAVRLDVHLQERLVGGTLHVDQVRHRRHLGDAPEIVTDALAPGKRPGNRVHELPCRPAPTAAATRSGAGTDPIPARIQISPGGVAASPAPGVVRLTVPI